LVAARGSTLPFLALGGPNCSDSNSALTGELHEPRGADRTWERPGTTATIDTVSTFQTQPLLVIRLTHYRKNWAKYTSDREILDTVRGMRIKFVDSNLSNYTHHMSCL